MAENDLRETVLSASPAQLITLLMDACIASLGAAAKEYRVGAIDAAAPHAAKARAIIAELKASLRPEAGGALAENLAMLYGTADSYIVRAESSRDAASLESASRVIAEIREAWKQIS